MNQMSSTLKPGEINLSLIPLDWPLTPIGDRKNPYIQGWQNKPFAVEDVGKELEEGRAKAVGLIGGPVYNEPYGLVWVDIDGPTVYDLIKKESGLPLAEAIPPTLTICSGREGRERKLYRVSKNNWDKFVRNKYAWHAEGDGEKLEILWKRCQGVLMGMHPDTEGYYTKEQEDFTFSKELPEIPDWILAGIVLKNMKQGKPNETHSRMYGESFAINAKLGHDFEVKEAVKALWTLPPECADDYDAWLTAGQALHSVDEALCDEWDQWSKQSEKYRDGACHQKWRSFSSGGGITAGTLYHNAKQYGFRPSQEYRAMPVADESIEALSDMLKAMLDSEPDVPDEITFNKVQTFPKSRQFDGDADGNEINKKRNAPANELCDILTQMFAGMLLFDPASNQFYIYEREAYGLWSGVSEAEMKYELYSMLSRIKNELLPRGFGVSTINDQYILLSQSLQNSEWNIHKELILFRNGIFNTATEEIEGFKKENYINHSLPYEYDSSATCEPIVRWLKFTQHNDWERVQLLRAWLRAVLTSSDSIQRFVEIVGPGKSGKSTFANLCHALVGFDNAAVSTMERLEKNRFETSKLVNKKLLLFNDVERYGGNVSMLKALTGTDLINCEHKYKQTESTFKFDGLIIITANEQIQTTDPSSGLFRRRLTIPFDRPFTGNAKQQKVLINCDRHSTSGEFAPYMPGLVNWVLQMSEEDMRSYLLQTQERVAYFQKFTTQQHIRSNPIMDWLHTNIVFDSNCMSYIGDCKPAAKDSRTYYHYAETRLYANYGEFCRNNNVNMMSRARFENMLMDILNHQLNLNVYKGNQRTIQLFNIRIRSYETDSGYPSLIDLAQDVNKYRDFYGNIQLEHKVKNTNVEAEDPMVG